MAENYTPINVATFVNDTTAVNTVNNNFAAISTAFTDVLSRSGVSPNPMGSTLDMNNNQIINLPPPSTSNSPARLIDVVSNPSLTIPATGTSGHVVPFLDGNNTWSGTNTYNITPTFINPIIVGSVSSAVNGSVQFIGATSGSSTISVAATTGLLNVGGAATITNAGLTQLGTTAFTAFGSYVGGVTNTFLQNTRGTGGSPITDQGANVVLSSVQNTSTGSGTVLYANCQKLSTAANVGNRAAWFEVFDTVGGAGSYAEGLRSSVTANGGTNSNVNGMTITATSSIAYAFLNGIESQVFNTSGTPATTTFNSTKFCSSFLASCGQGAGTAADAGFMINPNSFASYISGFYVPNKVSDTAFRCDATLVNGVDLSRGTYSGFTFKAPNFTIAGSTGNVLSAGNMQILNTTAVPAGGTLNTGYTFSSTANFGIFFGNGAPTLSAAQGSIYLNTAGSSTSTRLFVNTNGSTGWTNFTSAT